MKRFPPDHKQFLRVIYRKTTKRFQNEIAVAELSKKWRTKDIAFVRHTGFVSDNVRMDADGKERRTFSLTKSGNEWVESDNSERFEKAKVFVPWIIAGLTTIVAIIALLFKKC